MWNFEFQICADFRRRVDAGRRLSLRRSFLENLPEEGRSKVCIFTFKLGIPIIRA
jgi:hypothetical protein